MDFLSFLPACSARLPGAADVLALTKPRIAVASVLTVVGGYVAASGAADAGLAHTAGGSFLAAAGSLAYNQWWERDSDLLMARTSGRPLPQGRMRASTALAWGLGFSIAGLIWLYLACGTLASLIGAAIIIIYGFIYTPMKRLSRRATEIGAVSGALPPLLGAAAAGQPESIAAWTLAGILLFWQMPHFYAIGWIHRADYRAAGLPLQPTRDPDGKQTASLAVLHVLATAVVAIWPLVCGHFGWVYGLTAGVTMAWLIWRAIRWRLAVDRNFEARRLFRATLFTLPPLMFALMIEGML
jgi:protoheme IX farnesyltransferase